MSLTDVSGVQGPITSYVINLKRRPKQYEFFYNNNKKLINDNKINLIRFEAVDGFEENEKQSKIMLKNPVHKQRKHGVFGCFLSHLMVLQIIAQMQSNEWVFILEDDAIINPEIFNIWPYLMSQTKLYDINVVFLSRSYASKDTFIYQPIDGFNLVKVSGEFWGCQFYMVRPQGAKQLLASKEMNPYESVPYDIALANIAQSENFIYAAIIYNKNDEFWKKDPLYSGPWPFVNTNILAYANLSSTMGSSTEEYFENSFNYTLIILCVVLSIILSIMLLQMFLVR